ncbi:MAG: ketopantoate reductase family protein [Oscillospiraceae bacterium]|nr:ketopantoate reductase family protein [Oscillospiraceae bacterium]
MSIQTIAVLGAGAIGSYFIDGLREKLGDHLWVIAEGERAERLKEKGIVVNGETLRLNVRTPEQAHGADFLIVTVKYGGLSGSLPMIEKIVDDHTIVMSPMNGVDSEMVIGEVIGMEHVVYSLMRIASRRVGNEIRYDPEVTQGVYFGETEGTRSQRILDLMELFDDTPVRYSISSDIRQDIWYKYALNISKNIPQAIVGCGYGGYRDSSHLSYISDKMREEVAQVAWAKGIDIRDTDNPGAHNSPIPAEARFSTLQDLDAKRETEIEMFCGTLVRMGRELGIETPFNDFAYHVIRCLEEKNAGKLK